MFIGVEEVLESALEVTPFAADRSQNVVNKLTAIEEMVTDSHKRLRESDSYRKRFIDSERPVEELDPTRAREIKEFFTRLDNLRVEAQQAAQYFSGPVVNDFEALAQAFTEAGPDAGSVDVERYECVEAALRYHESFNELLNQFLELNQYMWDNDHFIDADDGDELEGLSYELEDLVKSAQNAFSEIVYTVRDFTAR